MSQSWSSGSDSSSGHVAEQGERSNRQAVLAGTLATIKNAGLLAVDRKAAVRRATELTFGTDPDAPVEQEAARLAVLDDCERCLSEARRLWGRGTTFQELQVALKGAGNVDMARRIAKLNRSRRLVAHPDPTIAQEFVEALQCMDAPRQSEAPWPSWKEEQL